jgi:sulfonate transport system ATP-binding protein
MSQGRIGTSRQVTLTAADRDSSIEREGLRSALLADLGLATLH